MLNLLARLPSQRYRLSGRDSLKKVAGEIPEGKGEDPNIEDAAAAAWPIAKGPSRLTSPLLKGKKQPLFEIETKLMIAFVWNWKEICNFKIW